jgi:voltage-gated potassium channel
MSKRVEEKFNLFQVVIVVLSLYVLVTLVISTFFKLSTEIQQLLDYIDNIICVVFLIDFCIRFYKSDNKLKFMKWGWIDLVSSIPTLEMFRAGRLLRLVRILRILRAFRSTKVLIGFVFKRKAHGAFTTASIFAVLILFFSSIAILQVENTENGNIKTAEDALWWAFTTITTVGYGDKFPVTTEGRIIGVILMTAGVGLFGVFTGFIASWFVEEHKKEDEEESKLAESED